MVLGKNVLGKGNRKHRCSVFWAARSGGGGRWAGEVGQASDMSPGPEAC